MKNRTIILILFILINGGILHADSDCFENNILRLGESLGYPEIGKILSKEIEIQFKLYKGKFEVDTTKLLMNRKLIEPIINEIERSELIARCDGKPQRLTVRFDFSIDKSVMYHNQELVITESYGPDYQEYAQCYRSAAINIEPKKWIYGVDVIKGDGTVFLYRLKNRNPFIPTNRMDERIFFQIPSGIEEFEFTDKELGQLQLFYQNVCLEGCGGEFIKTGKVKGKLEDEFWIVEIQINDRKFEIKYKNS